MTFELIKILDFASYVLQYKTLCYGDRSGPDPQASFFQNTCHYMMIIYTVIRPGLMPNYYTMHIIITI
jgi:hypothetical protein